MHGAIRSVVFALALAAGAFAAPAPAPAATAPLRVAVAASAREALGEIAGDFERRGNPHVVLISGASGAFAQQIAQGAPFDLFYSADSVYPARLAGLKLVTNRRAYARGRLVAYALASAPFDPRVDGLRPITTPAVRHLAIANPALAPYGRAALEALRASQIEGAARPKLVLGTSVAQASQFVLTGNAEMGLLPLSVVVTPSVARAGHYWLVPQDRYQPIIADAAIVRASHQAKLALAFLGFSLSHDERPVWDRYGFESAAVMAALGGDPLGLSLVLAGLTTALLLVVGLPLAAYLAYSRSRLRWLLEAAVALPLVLPPSVLGFYLLVAMGPAGGLGRPWLWLFHRPLAFSFGGLVLASLAYSLPFAVQPMQAAFQGLDPQLLEAARTLGASRLGVFWRVVAPNCLPGVVAAAVLAFTHTLGEFGVALMVGGNIPGETRTVAIAIYDLVESFDYAAAGRQAAILLVGSYAALLALYGYQATEEPAMAAALSFAVTRRCGGFTLAVAGELPVGLTALVGPSGAGKTSLLRCLAGLDRPAEGHVRLNGERWFEGGAHVPVAARRVGVVFEGGALFPHLSVIENVGFGLPRGPAAREHARACLAAFEAEHLADRRPRRLSAGERQRVAIAQAIAPAPRLLLLDEPFAALDADLRGRLRQALARAVAERGIPALLVTHDLAEAAAIGDRLAVMAAGRWLQVGSPEAVLFRPNTAEVARLVGVANRFVSPVAADGRLQWGPYAIASAPASPAPAGTRVGWCVRAEAIAPWQPGAPNRIEGVVQELAPAPAGYGFQLAVAGLDDRLAVAWSAPVANAAGLADGRAIAITLPPAAVHRFAPMARA